MKQYKLINNLVGWIAFAIAAVTYCLTVEPSASFWDCPEFISTASKLDVGHPPGAPFFMLTGSVFSRFASDPTQVAFMINIMSALLSAVTILFLFWTVTHLTRQILCKDGVVQTWAQLIVVMAAGLTGALAYAWSDTSWLFFALLSAVFAALTAIFAKIGLEGLDSDFATFIRTVFIVGIVALWVSFLGKWQSPATVGGRQWLFLALSATATGLSWLFYFKALQLGQAAHVAPVDKLSVVFVAFFAVAFLGERLSAREWFGIALIVCGVVCLTLKPSAPAPVSSSVQVEQGHE